MRYAISKLLAGYILRPLEVNINNNFYYTSHKWLKYMNAIFILYQHKYTLLNTFLQHINNFDCKIMLILKVQQNAYSLFDVLLIKNYHGKAFKLWNVLFI